MKSKRKFICMIVIIGVILNMFWLNQSKVFATNNSLSRNSVSETENENVNSYGKEGNTVSDMERSDNFEKDMERMDIKVRDNEIYYYTIIILVIVLVVLIIICVILKKRGKSEIKGKILILLIGMVIGAMITTASFMMYNKANVDTKSNPRMMNGQMQNEEKADENLPEMPNNTES